MLLLLVLMLGEGLEGSVGRDGLRWVGDCGAGLRRAGPGRHVVVCVAQAIGDDVAGGVDARKTLQVGDVDTGRGRGGLVCSCGFVGLDGLLVLFEDGAGHALKVGAHPRHEAGVVAGPVAGDERGKEGGRHVERLEVLLGLGVVGVSKDVHKDGHHGEKDVVEHGPAGC